MSYGTRSFAISVTAPSAPVVGRHMVRRPVAVLKGAVHGPPRPGQQLPPPPGRVPHIIAQAAARHAAGYWDVCGPSHKARFVRARWLALVMLRDAYKKRGLVWLGQQVNRDHTTVLSALRRVSAAPDLVTSPAAMARSRDEAAAEAALLARCERRRLRRARTIAEMEEVRARRESERRLREAACADRRAFPKRQRGTILTFDQVRSIKALIRSGWRDCHIAQRFGVRRQNIYKIRHGENWRDVP